MNINQNHPIWGIIRVAIVMGGLVLILWKNASSFDETELRVVLEFIGLYMLTSKQVVKGAGTATTKTAEVMKSAMSKKS